MTEPRRDPWLLTPGPLTTSRTVKEAMLHDCLAAPAPDATRPDFVR